ncbi:MAG TPA: hypothetical protein VNF74_14065 [Terriglobales bacterium]|nr:hypothetical protein [Terriglobales bacterium]
MKEITLRLILAGLFAVSIGAAGATLVEVASAAPATPSCPKTCNEPEGNCPGTTCTCQFINNAHTCATPLPPSM